MHGPACVFWADRAPCSPQQLHAATEHARAAEARTEQAAALAGQHRAAAAAKAELEDVVGRLLRRQREATAREQKVRVGMTVSPLLLNENCTGLAQIVGQLQGSNRDFQPNCWAKSRNFGQPCTCFVLRSVSTRGVRLSASESRRSTPTGCAWRSRSG